MSAAAAPAHAAGVGQGDAEFDQSATGWAILELMGHRRLAGYLSEQQVAGAAMLRIDIPGDASTATQFYSAAAVYAITPTTEEIARAVARGAQPAPVHRWELPAAGHDEDDDTDAGDGPW